MLIVPRYTEDFMANLAYDAMAIWDALEKDAGTALRSMSGLLNFGDKDYGASSPEGKMRRSSKNFAHQSQGLSWGQLRTWIA